ncbi:hypothetical protein SAMD00019534_069600 [Acytostelium subglobosum LB1]|uniref:hypothetical protein n=1 Tax=Acytostelium subglobosum LB1 TaxID=1410327 RepID=UPI000644D4D6|nr:hypothetical protein SAMD00019534_069600 [Acytostelium subglobosum LB1]GAM23785.1 hypothetical protein SAMD00019534_069600 [Acytostelium subglobosum LB1]|eukprot:XP_012753526.1 hypothetical protein SAMD00019534_069600 [Acytostelium subglobosum LB1]
MADDMPLPCSVTALHFRHGYTPGSPLPPGLLSLSLGPESDFPLRNGSINSTTITKLSIHGIDMDAETVIPRSVTRLTLYMVPNSENLAIPEHVEHLELVQWSDYTLRPGQLPNSLKTLSICGPHASTVKSIPAIPESTYVTFRLDIMAFKTPNSPVLNHLLKHRKNVSFFDDIERPVMFSISFIDNDTDKVLLLFENVHFPSGGFISLRQVFKRGVFNNLPT